MAWIWTLRSPDYLRFFNGFWILSPDCINHFPNKNGGVPHKPNLNHWSEIRLIRGIFPSFRPFSKSNFGSQWDTFLKRTSICTEFHISNASNFSNALNQNDLFNFLKAIESCQHRLNIFVPFKSKTVLKALNSHWNEIPFIVWILYTSKCYVMLRNPLQDWATARFDISFTNILPGTHM